LEQEKEITVRVLKDALLHWYDRHQRALPWRAVPGCSPNPYHVWLSEIMLQQTTVATVKDYFARFVTRWPRVEGLAKAALDDVFHAWQGLGYYSRARNLHRCAQTLVKDFKGILPKEEQILLTLPGVGPYTAAAIAAIAYDQATLPVDGNVVRVFSRIFSLKTPLPALKNEVQILAKTMTPSYRSGDFAQSLMDLGATVCRPRNPACEVCPLQGVCKGYHQGVAARLPFPAVKEIKPRRYGVAFWVEDEEKKILLEKRPDKGLLAGLIGLPTTVWKDTPWDLKSEGTFMDAPPGVERWEAIPIVIRHTFTHFHLELRVMKGKSDVPQKGLWSSLDNIKSHALPTVMKKVIRQVAEASCPSPPK
jgi:A/G-specific adenine glycosylase